MLPAGHRGWAEALAAFDEVVDLDDAARHSTARRHRHL